MSDVAAWRNLAQSNQSLLNHGSFYGFAHPYVISDKKAHGVKA
jgi:hypothetical protein